MSDNEKVREARVRRVARRQGFIIRKSRIRNMSSDDQGGYRIVEARNNLIAAGEKFDLSLEDIEKFVADE